MPSPFICVGHAKVCSVLFARTPAILSRNLGMPFYFQMLPLSAFISLRPNMSFVMNLCWEGQTNFIKTLFKPYF
jgi:hypothetical protein